MSKDLNLEYKKHIENEIPDLWNRIEEALPSKNIDDNVISFESGNNNSDNIVKKKRNRISIYFGTIAACVVCALSIPIFLLSQNSAKSQTASAEIAMDEAIAAEEFYEDEDADVSNVNEAIAEETAVAEETYADEDMEASFADEVPSEANDMASEMNIRAESDEAATEESSSDRVILAGVHIEVKEIFEDNGKSYATVAILDDASMTLNSGDEIKIEISSYAYENGEAVQLPFAEGDKLMVELLYDSSDGASEYYLLDITEFD